MSAGQSSPSTPPVSRFLSGASSLVALQASTRLLTFVLNQALVRLASPQVFGTAAIQFELLLSTILFLSREGCRQALLRIPVASISVNNTPEPVLAPKEEPAKPSNASKRSRPPRKQLQTTATTAAAAIEEEEEEVTLHASEHPLLASNVATIPFLLGIPMSIICATVYFNTALPEATSQSNFLPAVALYVLAAVLELSVELLYITAQNDLAFGLRVRSEGVGVLARTATTFVLLVGTPPRWALIAFGCGQLAYALAIVGMYWQAYPHSLYIWPKTVTRKEHRQWFDPVLFRLSLSMTLQSIFKYFLTDADKFAVARLSELSDQGGYAVASNYGSLVARIVFQPIEEMSRVYFSKTLAECTTEPEARNNDPIALRRLLQEKPLSTLTPSQTTALESAARTITTLLLFEAHLSLLFLTFLPPYLPTLLSHFLPSRYRSTSAPAVLQSYAYYLPVMSLNGVLEALAHSIMSPNDLKYGARWLLAFSILFVFTSSLFIGYLEQNEVGLVWKRRS